MATRENTRQRLFLVLLSTIGIGLSIIGRQTRSAQALVQHPQLQPQTQPHHPSSSRSRTTNRRDFLHQIAATTTAVVTASVLGDDARAAAGATATAITGTAPTPISIPKPPQLPPIGLGCWAWGDSLFWGPSDEKQLQDVFEYVVSTTSSSSSSSSSSVLLDTAEVYGFGKSEQLIGQFTKTVAPETQAKLVVATKFAAVPFRTKPINVVKAAQGSLARLDRGPTTPIDLYQIHFPNAFANAAYWEGLADAYDQGLVKSVGVSNYGVDAVRACHAALAQRGIPLTSNQIQYSLLYRYPETHNALLQTCNELNVQVLAYSPLALGLLGGKYRTLDSVQKVGGGPRKKIFRQTIARPEFQQLVHTMEEIAHQHPNANVAQVAINWCRAKGTIPIPGARTLTQVQSNYAALSWKLTPAEIAVLDAASANYSYIDPTASPFPKQDKDTGLIMFDS